MWSTIENHENCRFKSPDRYSDAKVVGDQSEDNFPSLSDQLGPF